MSKVHPTVTEYGLTYQHLVGKKKQECDRMNACPIIFSGFVFWEFLFCKHFLLPVSQTDIYKYIRCTCETKSKRHGLCYINMTHYVSFLGFGLRISR